MLFYLPSVLLFCKLSSGSIKIFTVLCQTGLNEIVITNVIVDIPHMNPLEFWMGTKDHSWQPSIFWTCKSLLPGRNFCSIWSYLQYLLPFFHSSIIWIPLNDSRNWSFITHSLFLSTIFLRIGTFLDRSIPGFPQKPVGLSLRVQMRLVVHD